MACSEKGALAEKLLDSVDFASHELKQLWETETARRVAEIENGEAVGISSKAVFSRARRKLSEARRLSPARSRQTG
jgi:hypothetical protein